MFTSDTIVFDKNLHVIVCLFAACCSGFIFKLFDVFAVKSNG